MTDSRGRLVVAIDGPAGAGKSTVARLVAERLGYIYIDTGAMYRAVAWVAAREGAEEDESEQARLAAEMDFRFVSCDKGQRVIVNGVDATAEIRSPEISRLASPVSAVPAVRECLVALQRHLGRDGGVVMEGRDIGTVVFPDAEVKIFLTASTEERAGRRWLELQEKGVDVSRSVVLRDIEERDRRDSSRHTAPLRPADDALIIDSDGRSIPEVVGEIVDACRRLGRDHDDL